MRDPKNRFGGPVSVDPFLGFLPLISSHSGSSYLVIKLQVSKWLLLSFIQLHHTLIGYCHQEKKPLNVAVTQDGTLLSNVKSISESAYFGLCANANPK